jgi:hypothetical protein
MLMMLFGMLGRGDFEREILKHLFCEAVRSSPSSSYCSLRVCHLGRYKSRHLTRMNREEENPDAVDL